MRGGQYTPKPAYFAYQCLCALFDAKTRQAGLQPALIGQERVELLDAGFVRNGRALYAWWFPASLTAPWERRRMTVRCVLPAGAKLETPVLIDPLSARVHRFERVKTEGAAVTLSDLPLLEYPLILADGQTVGQVSNLP